jgi:AcrR family transcriptional regulator
MTIERKNQIVHEAIRLFSRHGFNGVTIRQLADACGITEPALYRHFSSKEAIYVAVLDTLKTYQNHDDLFNRLDAETELEPILHGLASHILGFFSSHREIYRLLLFSTLRQHAKARQVFREIRGPYVTFLIERLDRLYTEGKIVKKNNVITARCFIGMVFDCTMAATLWRGFLGKNYGPEDVIANNVQIFVDGLLPRKDVKKSAHDESRG